MRASTIRRGDRRSRPGGAGIASRRRAEARDRGSSRSRSRGWRSSAGGSSLASSTTSPYRYSTRPSRPRRSASERAVARYLRDASTSTARAAPASRSERWTAPTPAPMSRTEAPSTPSRRTTSINCAGRCVELPVAPPLQIGFGELAVVAEAREVLVAAEPMRRVCGTQADDARPVNMQRSGERRAAVPRTSHCFAACAIAPRTNHAVMAGSIL